MPRHRPERIGAEEDHGVGQVRIATGRGRDLHEHGQHGSNGRHDGDERNDVGPQRLLDLMVWITFFSHFK